MPSLPWHRTQAWRCTAAPSTTSSTVTSEPAANTGQTLTALIEDALRAMLARAAAGPRRKGPRLPTDGAGGLQPGVDLDDSAGLLDLMEGGA